MWVKAKKGWEVEKEKMAKRGQRGQEGKILAGTAGNASNASSLISHTITPSPFANFLRKVPDYSRTPVEVREKKRDGSTSF
jgi:hypothetical protein